jgi:Mg-chelatase subunit ChlD
LSFDYDFLIDFVSGISVDTIDQRFPGLSGTAIGDGMMLAADGLLRDTTEREKIMILIADGEANTGVDPLVALKYLKDNSIKTYTI